MAVLSSASSAVSSGIGAPGRGVHLLELALEARGLGLLQERLPARYSSMARLYCSAMLGEEFQICPTVAEVPCSRGARVHGRQLLSRGGDARVVPPPEAGHPRSSQAL